MNSTLTTDQAPEKKQPRLIKNLVTRVFCILAAGSFIIAGVIGYNIIANDPGDNPDRLIMSDKEIKQMLIKDTKRIDLFIKSIQKIPKEVATILGLQKLNKEEIKIILNSILLNSPELFGTTVAYEPNAVKEEVRDASSYVYRKDGIVKYLALDDPEYDYFHKDWYLLPKILQQPVWTEPYYDDGGGGVFMTAYSVPFYFFDGVKETFTGITTVDISIDWLTHYFTANTKLPNNGSVILISGNGTIISTERKEWMVNDTIFTLALSLNIPKLREIGRDIQRGISGTTTVIVPLTRKTVKIFYSVIKANKWGILYIIPEEAVE